MPQRIVFLGTKPIGFHCLEYLLSQCEKLDIEVIAVGTKRRAEFGNGNDVVGLAQMHSIRLIDKPEDIPECDLIYSVQYHHILKPAQIAKAQQASVNLHMAPLPEYRGCNQFSFAIIDGRKEFGTTIHLLDAGIDSGDILFEKRFSIPQEIWVADLYQLTYDASLKIFKETLADIVRGNYQPVPQASFAGERSSSIHYRKEMDDLKKIELSWDAEKIDRHLRATSMPGFEPPYCIAGGEKIYFTRAER
jgi:methionyl-tRNA formyltransferase